MGLRVLITNLYVAHGTGSETVVELLADGLRRAGHEPVVYAPTLGPQAVAMRRRGHVVVDRLAEVPFRPDVLHLQHVTPAAMALAQWPDVPAVFACHSALYEVEAPRPHPQIRRWIAVDELCRERCLSRGVPADRLEVVPNAVDLPRFRARPPLPARPTRALVLTKTSEQLEPVRAACAAVGIALDALGPGAGRVTDRLEEELPRYDLVFATARMALEAAAVGCAVVVGDGRGFAGLLTTERLEAWRRLNFGAGLLTRPMTAEAVAAAIAGYDAADAAAVTARLRATAGAEHLAAAHVAAYRAALADPAPPAAAVASATAAWLEDLLPTAAERAWREVARETAAFVPAPVEAALAALRTELAGVAAVAKAAAPEILAGQDAAVARLRQEVSDGLAALPGPRLERALRAAWRRLVPEALRRPLHRWRRAILRPAERPGD